MSVDDSESRLDSTLRPAKLADYIGQTKVKDNLRVFMKAALSGVRRSITSC